MSFARKDIHANPCTKLPARPGRIPVFLHRQRGDCPLVLLWGGNMGNGETAETTRLTETRGLESGLRF